jgi:hypothetical protein
VAGSRGNLIAAFLFVNAQVARSAEYQLPSQGICAKIDEGFLQNMQLIMYSLAALSVLAVFMVVKHEPVKFVEIQIYDHSLGFDGGFEWKKLPKPMTRGQAIKYAAKMGWSSTHDLR